MNDLFLTECLSFIINVTDKGIVCSKTVALPKNNLYEGDRGILTVNRIRIPFTDTKKNSSSIYHVVEPDFLNDLKNGLEVRIEIDIKRRKQQIINLLRVYLFLMAIDFLYPEIKIKNTHVKKDEICLKITKNKVLSLNNIEKISIFINDIISKNQPINYKGNYMPSTSYIGNIKTIKTRPEGIIAKFNNTQDNFPWYLFYNSHSPFIL